MTPNANGGLHVGLGVEPTVSYSSEERQKMLIINKIKGFRDLRPVSCEVLFIYFFDLVNFSLIKII